MEGVPSIPTKVEIEKLPLLARVAFAARCARRVLPIYERWAKRNRDEHGICAVVSAIEFAERPDERSQDSRSSGANAVARAVDAAADAAADAARTARTARAAADAAANGSAAFAANRSLAAARAAHAAAAAHDVVLADEVLRGTRRDFDMIIAKAREEGWTDATPVPPEAFPPMWPEGAPDWARDIPIPDNATGDSVEPLSICFDITEFSADDISRMLAGISSLYRECGGDELVIRKVELLDPAHVLVPDGVTDDA